MAHCFILVFDITNQESFVRIKQTLNEIRQSNTYPIVLAGSKLDRESERVVPKSMAQDFAHLNNMDYFEVSSQENINIDEMFIRVGERSIDTNLVTQFMPVRAAAINVRRHNNYSDDLDE